MEKAGKILTPRKNSENYYSKSPKKSQKNEEKSRKYPKSF